MARKKLGKTTKKTFYVYPEMRDMIDNLLERQNLDQTEFIEAAVLWALNSSEEERDLILNDYAKWVREGRPSG